MKEDASGSQMRGEDGAASTAHANDWGSARDSMHSICSLDGFVEHLDLMPVPVKDPRMPGVRNTSAAFFKEYHRKTLRPTLALKLHFKLKNKMQFQNEIELYYQF